jgi:hypothetical protein
MRWIPISLVAITWLEGCAAAYPTTDNYEAMLKTWVGRSEAELVQTWGPPSSVYQSANGKYFTYAKSKTCSYGKDAFTCVCNTTFELASDHIRSWRWDGNGCSALPPDQQSLPFSTGRSDATPRGGSAP